MNAAKNARVDMIDAVILFFDEHPEVIVFAPALARDLSLIKTNRLLIDTSLEKTENSTKSMVYLKQDLKKVVLASAKMGIAAAAAHADGTSHKELQTNMTEWGKKLRSPSDVELPLICKGLISDLRALGNDLAERGFSQADVTELETLVADFKVNNPKLKLLLADVTTEHAHSESVISKTCAIIRKQMSKTMNVIKAKNKALFDAFLKAKKVKTTTPNTTTLHITLIDSVTNFRIADVPVMHHKSKKAVKSAADGLVILQKGITKAKVVNILQDGYEPFQLIAPALERGKVTALDVYLVPTTMAVKAKKWDALEKSTPSV
jgi:hypothetical protein